MELLYRLNSIRIEHNADFKMKNKPRLQSIVISLVFVIISLTSCAAESKKSVATYEECVEAGNVILRSMPPQCVTRDGKRFVASDKDRSTRRERKKYCQNMCGDGSCQVLVCQAVGCPCPESPSTCPADCKESGE